MRKIRKSIVFSIIAVLAVIVILLILFKGRLFPPSGGEDFSSERPFKVFYTDLFDKINEIGEVHPVEIYNLRFPVSEEVSKIYVSEDSMVKKGDLLICVDNTQISAQTKSLEAKVLEAEYNLRASDVYDSKKTLEIQEKKMNAKNTVAMSDKTLAAAQELLSKKLISKEKLELIKNQNEAAHKAFEIILEEEKNAEDEKLKTEALSKNLESLRFQLRQASKILEECCLKSPIDGKVIWMKRLKAGELAAKNEVAVRVADMDEVEIKAYLFESDVWRVESGAEIFIRSGEEKIPAAIKRISDVAEQLQGGNKFPCYLSSTNVGGRFRVGSNVEVVFLVDKRPNILVVPLKYLVQKKGQFFVFKKENGRIKEILVEVGFDDTKYIEIMSGLEEGDTIIYPYERF
ncbi:MAG: efflux RND transporter periplasmic adaptor subunit [Candidatus Aminicenantaceae bacterium]